MNNERLIGRFSVSTSAHYYGATGGGGRIAIGLKLSASQLNRLYERGHLNGMQVIPLADLPEFDGRYSVIGGRAATGAPPGTEGTAVLTLSPPAGSVLFLR